MAGPLDHWTKIKDSQILSSDSSYMAGPLDLWTKNKIHRLYQVILHKWLDHWTFGPKS